jgi:segregation and condensation protein B
VVERYVLAARHTRLTKAALETLSIVAYKQPVTRHQISGIRGVNSEGVLRALVDRGLVAEVGRGDPGQLMLAAPRRSSSSAWVSVRCLPPLASSGGLPWARAAEPAPTEGGCRSNGCSAP